MADAPLFVARPSDVAALRAHYDAAVAGSSRTVLLTAPLGGGKRAVVGELLRGIENPADHVIVRITPTDEEDGLRTLLRIYAGLYGALMRDPALRGKVELSLNSQAPSQTKRVQGWYAAFVEGMKKAIPNEGEQTFQVTLPRDNPLVGFAEVLAAIARRNPVVLEIQNVHAIQSLAIAQLVEGIHEAAKDGHLLLVLGSEPLDDAARAWVSEPWQDFLNRRGEEVHRLDLDPWGADEVSAYAASKSIVVAAPERVAEIAKGRPAYVAELIDVLAERNRLGDALEGDSLQTLVNTHPDEDELEEPPAAAPAGENPRRHATAADAPRVQFLAALLGLAFPAGLIADMDGLERDSVDDLIDACPELFAEVQFSKGLGTWIYQFKKGIWREAVLDAHTSDEDQDLARRVAGFLERYFVPRGYEYLVKTIRMYADHGAPNKAAMLRMGALSADGLDAWVMAHDAMRWFGTIQWPEPMRRVVYSNLLDRMVQDQRVNPDSAENLVQEVLKFSDERQDRALRAFTLFAGSRLDLRRGDHYRARDRAKDARTVYAEMDAKPKVAEIENHLALVEFQDGNMNAAIDHVRHALEASNTPPVQANAEYIRGLIDRKNRKSADAAEHFRKANELAGNIGMASLALEAGFYYGEALLLSGQNSKAADILQRVAQIAQVLQNKVRERAAFQLLGQCHAGLRQFEAALQFAQRTLALTQELKFDRFFAADVFNVGFFQLQLGRATEAASLFGKAVKAAPADDPNFLREVHFFHGVANLRIGEKATASSALREGLRHAQATKDLRKVMQANELLADLELERGDKASAARLYQDALKAADSADLREERRGIRKKLDGIGG